jgi:hypothetical protein
MAQGIFVSSASPDATIVRNLVTRLRALGLDAPAALDLPHLWHYEEDMTVGNNIFKSISEAIDASAVAVLCLSDAALARPWIVSEVTLLKRAIADKRLLEQNVITVKVGPVTDESLKDVRQFVSSPDRFEADVTSGEETKLENLAAQIFNRLGANAPKLLPIAVLAMRREQAAALLDDWRKRPETPVAEICSAVGLRPPELYELISGRYGDRPEDMMPFRSDTLMTLVHQEMDAANVQRIRRRYVPLFPRWIHGELFGTEVALVTGAVNTWRKNNSLLIVDAISTYHPEIEAQLGRAPEPGAVLCLPPYTRQTVRLEEAFESAFALSRLSGWFGEWRSERPDRRSADDGSERPNRMLAFDTGTYVAMGDWLERRFLSLPGEYAAHAPARDSLPVSSFRGTPKQ